MYDPNYPYYVPQFGVGEAPASYPGTGFDETGLNPNLVAGGGGGAGGTTNFNQLVNRPKYAGTVMTGSTNIPLVPQRVQDLSDGQALELKVANNTTDIASNTTIIGSVSSDLANLETTVANNATAATTALATEKAARENADKTLQANIEAVEQSVENLSNITDGYDEMFAKTIQLDTTLSSDTSTVTLTKSLGSLDTDSATETELALPVASETQAGVMNTSTYKAVQENSELIGSILNGAVAIEGLPAVPTQEELTTRWKNASGEAELINRASIFDITNQKVWYYYSNVSAWQATSSDGSQVTVSQATNTSLGIVKGSTNDGQVAIEADGSMSLNGWDDLKSDVETGLTRITNLPSQVVYKTSLPEYKEDEVDLTLVVKDLHTGGDASLPLNIMAATTTNAGVMSAQHLTQLNTNTNEINTLGTQVDNLDMMVDEAQKDVNDALADIAGLDADKQDKLTSGVNIATVNGESLLQGGNIEIEGGGEPMTIAQFNLLWENA